VLVEFAEEFLAKPLHRWWVEHGGECFASSVLVVEVVLERGERADVPTVPVHDRDEVAVHGDGEEEFADEAVVRIV
jgi:hypothetical protein